MIIDDKVIMFPPPPPYANGPSGSVHSSPYASSLALPANIPSQGRGTTLTTLPPHILLQIIHHTFPQGRAQAPAYSPTDQYDTAYYEDTKSERQRKTLYWLSSSLRGVSRQLYTACMHVLRSTYLPSYQALIRAPYSSDPFPMGVPTSSSSSSSSSANPAASSTAMAPPAYRSPSPSPSSLTFTADTSPLITPHRETPILDRFILLKVRMDLFADESELHLDREDAFRDLFDVAQPRARLEDLLRMYGVQDGVVCVPGWGRAGAGPQSPTTPGKKVYAHSNGSQSSSLMSLPLSPSTPTSPSASKQPPPQQEPPARRSFFSFGKKAVPVPSPLPRPATKISTSVPPVRPRITPVPFPSLSISFSPRKVGVLLNRSRTIAEVPRQPGRRDTLEALARGLVRELRTVLEEGV